MELTKTKPVGRGLAVLLAMVACAAARAAATATPTPTPAADGGQRAAHAATRPYPIRGIYDRDLSASGFDDEAAIGFNVIDSDPNRTELDTLAARQLKGLVWLGGYSNDTAPSTTTTSGSARTCGRSPATAPSPRTTSTTSRTRRSAPPLRRRCAPGRGSSKSIDPRPPTLLVSYKLEQFPLFAGTVDIIGLDHYPCSIKDGCDFTRIDKAAAAADRAGIRYWGVIQAFGDSYYKLPTPDELAQQFAHWRTTRMEGYLVFSWHWPPNQKSLWLANHPELQRQLSIENGS